MALALRTELDAGLASAALTAPRGGSPHTSTVRPTASSRTLSPPGRQHPARNHGVPGCSPRPRLSPPPPQRSPAPPPAPCRNPGPPRALPTRARTHRAGEPHCRGSRGARPQGLGTDCRLSPADSAAWLRGPASTPRSRRVPMSAAAGAPWPATAPRRPGTRLPQAVAGSEVGCISPDYIAAPGLRGGVGNAEPARLPAPHVRKGGGGGPRGGERRGGVGTAGAPAH